MTSNWLVERRQHVVPPHGVDDAVVDQHHRLAFAGPLDPQPAAVDLHHLLPGQAAAGAAAGAGGCAQEVEQEAVDLGRPLQVRHVGDARDDDPPRAGDPALDAAW